MDAVWDFTAIHSTEEVAASPHFHLPVGSKCKSQSDGLYRPILSADIINIYLTLNLNQTFKCALVISVNTIYQPCYSLLAIKNVNGISM